MQHIRGGAAAALAAGVNLMLAATTTAAAQAAGMLAPDGHCKSLDASADGYARSVYCLLILLNLCEAELSNTDFP